MIYENYGLTVEKQRRSQPKGGMCDSCWNRAKNCSGLPFEDMKTINTFPLETGGVINVVRCDSFTVV